MSSMKGTSSGQNGAETSRGQEIFATLWLTFQKYWGKITSFHRNSNKKLSKRWSDKRFVGAALCAFFIIAAIMLWVPSYLGVGNDGTITRTMQNAGLSYLEKDTDNANNYFTRVYTTRYSSTDDKSFQLVLIQIAQWLDNIFTNDQLFDIRFLSIIYVILALPGFWLLFLSIVSRADSFVEKCVLTVMCVIVFADVSYVTYFNSLYPEAIFIIGLAYLFGGCMMLQRRSKFAPLYWAAIVVGTYMLCFTRQHTGVIGFIVAFFCIAQLRFSDQPIGRVGIAFAATLVLIAGFCSLTLVENDFDTTSKVHSMTRGVLLQSSNPEKTVQEFNMSGSYALLADVSLYNQYSLTEESEYYLQNGFLDHYTTADIVIHYIKHPGAMFSMLDIGVKSAVNLRRECGNYENTTGMPAISKSIFFSMYSIFKSRSLPQTIAFPILLIVVCAAMSRSGWWRQKEPDRFYYVYFCSTLLTAAVSIIHLAVIVCYSGDAQFTQYNFISGFSLDCLILFTLAELLHRLNILEDAQEAK